MHNILPFIINLVCLGLIVVIITYYEMRKVLFMPLNDSIGSTKVQSLYFLRMKLRNSIMRISPLLLSISLSVLYIAPTDIFKELSTKSDYNEILLGVLLLYIFADVTMVVMDVERGGRRQVPSLVAILLLQFITLLSIFNIYILDLSMINAGAYRWFGYFFVWFAIMLKNSHASLFKQNESALQSIFVYFVFFQFFNHYVISTTDISLNIAPFVRIILSIMFPLIQVAISLVLQRIYNKLVMHMSYKENYKILLLFIFVLILIEGRLLT